MPNDLGALVYGTILVASLLSAESTRQETFARTVAAVVLALLAYWLTISYTEYAGHRLERGARFEYAGLARTAATALSLLVGAAVPLLVLVVFWVAGSALSTAVSAAIWSAVAAVIAAELISGVRANLSGAELARQTAVGALLGLAVIGLRLLLH